MSKWTIEEERLLAEKYNEIGPKPFVEIFGGNKSYKDISNRARKLGLRAPTSNSGRKTHAQYLEDLLVKRPELEVLEQYLGSMRHILHKSNICGHTWKVTPNKVLAGSGCPICNTHGKLTNEDIDYVLKPRGITRLSEYTGTLDIIKVKGDCGHEWETRYTYLQEGSGCPTCNKGFGYLKKQDLPPYATLYVIGIEYGSTRVIKVGITSQLLNNRLREIKSRIHKAIGVIPHITPIYQVQSSGKLIVDLETKLNIVLKEFKINSPIKFDGHTELFSSSSLSNIEIIITGLNGDYSVKVI